MQVSARTRSGMAALVAATLTLVVGGSSAVTPTSVAVGAPTVRLAPTPTLDLTIGKTKIAVRGPRTFRAGRVAINLTGRGGHRTAGVIRFKKGYDFSTFKADILESFSQSPDGLQALNRAIRHSTFYGGVAAEGGRTTHGTVVLPRAGRYVVYEFGGNVPRKVTTLRVTGPAVRRPAPASDGTVRARTGARWAGSSSLPHRGTFTFTNAATDSPHFLVLQHVARGTTRGEVVDCLSEPSCSFGFSREGSVESEVLSPGRSMTLSYRLPRGSYAEMCFFPDPVTGMPHAVMGMVRIITLR